MMYKPEDIKVTKSLAFAKRIVKLCQFIEGKRVEEMRHQIFKSGTSVYANVSESVYAQSTADFVNKLSIALKEARETEGWLDLLHAGNYIDDRSYNSINGDCVEIIKILTTIINRKKGNYDNIQQN